MNKEQREMKFQMLTVEIDRLPAIRCDTCENWFGQRGYCQKWDSSVPQENQETGCDEWIWDYVPF